QGWERIDPDPTIVVISPDIALQQVLMQVGITPKAQFIADLGLSADQSATPADALAALANETIALPEGPDAVELLAHSGASALYTVQGAIHVQLMLLELDADNYLAIQALYQDAATYEANRDTIQTVIESISLEQVDGTEAAPDTVDDPESDPEVEATEEAVD